MFEATKTNFYIFLPFYIYLPYDFGVLKPLNICFISPGLLLKPKICFKSQVSTLKLICILQQKTCTGQFPLHQNYCVKILLFCPGNYFLCVAVEKQKLYLHFVFSATTLPSFFSTKNIENYIFWKLIVLSTKCILQLGVSRSYHVYL